MTKEQVKAEFREAVNKEIARSTDADRIARLELAREFFTNPEFRKVVSDTVWNILNPGA